MANAVAEGSKTAGADVTLMQAAEFSEAQINHFDAFAFGCPAMGNEVLEESEFEPMFEACETKLGNKSVVIFGSYGWGDGEWMRLWVQRCEDAGAVISTGEGLIVNETPSDDDLNTCSEFGKKLIGA